MRSTGGPCDHCGTRQTPCWRKGPPESPTLCNACGARWIVKKSLVGYLPHGTSGAHSPKAPMLYTVKQPRGTKRKPRTSNCRVLQEQRPSSQRRGPGKRSQELSPAAQATFAQLELLAQLKQSVVRLASVQPPLFQPPPGQPPEPAGSLQVLLQRGGSQHAGLAGPAPQLTLLPGFNIQVKSLLSTKVSPLMDASISLRRRQRKCGSPSRAAT